MFGKQIKRIGAIFVIGVTCGGLLGISVKYPVTSKTIDSVHEICGQPTFASFKVGITGALYEVTCLNGRTFILK